MEAEMPQEYQIIDSMEQPWEFQELLSKYYEQGHSNLGADRRYALVHGDNVQFFDTEEDAKAYAIGQQKNLTTLRKRYMQKKMGDAEQYVESDTRKFVKEMKELLDDGD